jgi:predicted Zn-dependent protease
VIAGGATLTAEDRADDAEQAMQMGEVNRALKIVTALLENDETNYRARVVLGDVQLKRRHLDRAIGSYRLAMGSAPTDDEFARLVFKVAVIFNEQLGDAQSAVRELDLIRKRLPDTPNAEKAQKWILRIMDEQARDELTD